TSGKRKKTKMYVFIYCFFATVFFDRPQKKTSVPGIFPATENTESTEKNFCASVAFSQPLGTRNPQEKKLLCLCGIFSTTGDTESTEKNFCASVALHSICV